MGGWTTAAVARLPAEAGDGSSVVILRCRESAGDKTPDYTWAGRDKVGNRTSLSDEPFRPDGWLEQTAGNEAPAAGCPNADAGAGAGAGAGADAEAAGAAPAKVDAARKVPEPSDQEERPRPPARVFFTLRQSARGKRSQAKAMLLLLLLLLVVLLRLLHSTALHRRGSPVCCTAAA
ncbi:hypothetical protein KC349_g1928 [Hortaea werneckii]|nr:hypothetical protein KC349_g1928 [Hortaea werneckii]